MSQGTTVPCSVCGKPRLWLRPARASAMCLRCARDAKKVPLEDRFWAKVDKNGRVPPHRPELGRCWLSGFAPGSHGYPVVDGKTAHNVALYLANDRWPELGQHLCDNKLCVKAWPDEFGPAHVIESNIAENNRDMFAKGRNRNGKELQTHCLRGHPLSGDNLHMQDRGNGHCYRVCRACSALRAREAKVSR
jgi:hypothetical protein